MLTLTASQTEFQEGDVIEFTFTFTNLYGQQGQIISSTNFTSTPDVSLEGFGGNAWCVTSDDPTSSFRLTTTLPIYHGTTVTCSFPYPATLSDYSSGEIAGQVFLIADEIGATESNVVVVTAKQ
jgi:hypothetical protein